MIVLGHADDARKAIIATAQSGLAWEIFSFEIILFMEGVALLLIAFIRGAVIPEGPVTA